MLLAVFISNALYPKVSVNQQQRFYGQILHLQIPCGMVGCYMPQHRHVKSIEADIRIIIVQIRSSLLLALSAAILAYIMARGGSGNHT